MKNNSIVIELLKQNLQVIKKQEQQQLSQIFPTRPQSANRIGMARKPPKLPAE